MTSNREVASPERSRGGWKHHIALEVAERIVAALRPHAERIEIAGSLRRGKPEVHDIDLVVIPRFVSRRSMFPPSRIFETDLYATALEVLSMVLGGDKIIRGLARNGLGGLPVVSEAPMVDIYIATADTWATLLLIRTGSVEHNIRLCTHARELGGKLHADGSGLELPGGYNAVLQRREMDVFYPQTEEEIFGKLGIAYLPPSLREQGVTWRVPIPRPDRGGQIGARPERVKRAEGAI